MRTGVMLFLVLSLVLPCALCTSSLLKLERSDTPLGPWQVVPAETLPITAGGAFQDTYESATGYYRMQIEPGANWGFPLTVAFEDVSPVAVGIAERLLESSSDLEEWEDAMLGPIAFPVYSPGVDGPAYMEFPLLGPQPEPPDLPFGGSNLKPQPTSGGPRPLIIGDCGLESRGYILVSLTEDDFPVVNYATAGPTRTECLRQRCGTSAARIVRYVGGFVAAEDQDGNLIGYLGDPPIRFASGILQYAGEQYEEYVTPQGSQNPPPPPVQFGPYASYDEFKKDYQDSVVYQEMRGRRKDAAKTDWDAELGREPEEILIPLGQDVTILENEKVSSVTFDNPDIVNFKILSVGIQMRGEKPGVTLMHVVFADQREADYVLGISEKNQSPQRPTGYVWTSWQYWYAEYISFQRNYSQEPGENCVSGCGATAWAMLYGFWDMWDCLAAAFGVPDLIPGDLIAGCPTPLTNNAAVRDCIWYIVPRIETYCSGSQGATNPWDMDGGTRWAGHRGGAIDYYARYTAPLLAWTWNGPRDLAISEIKNHDRASMVGFDWHYGLAYGHRYREKRGEWTGWVYARRRHVLVNMGWGGTTPEWHNAEDLWYAARTILMWP